MKNATAKTPRRQGGRLIPLRFGERVGRGADVSGIQPSPCPLPSREGVLRGSAPWRLGGRSSLRGFVAPWLRGYYGRSRRAGRGRPLQAFTLIEMLVSLAVISLALAVVGIVFSITVKTAGQSAAYSETHNWVRQFVQQIDEDLRYCDPSQSILVLAGRTQAAALTKSDLDAGKFYRVLIGNPANVGAGFDPEYGSPIDPQYSDPRADLLMFFSNRPTASVAPVADLTDDPYGAGVKFAPVLVTYGHAALGQAQWNGTNYQFPPDASLRHIENVGGLSPIPATRWHLGRRATILEPSPPMNKVAFDTAEETRITQCNHDGAMPGDVARLDVAAFFAGFAPLPPVIPALYSPYPPATGATWNPAWATTPTMWSYTLQQAIQSLLYLNSAEPNHHVAAVLEDVPVELKSNLGVHMLPGCAWLQVEFLMPEDPRNSVEYSADPSFSGMSQRSDMPRWTTVQAGATYVFVPDTPENRVALARDPTTGLPSARLLNTFARLDQSPGNDASLPATLVTNRIIRLWPYAIRITVRVWDAQKRLDEPIVRSIVHRFE